MIRVTLFFIQLHLLFIHDSFFRTVLEAGSPHMMEMTAGEVALYVVRRFLVVFFGSAVIGALFALAAALLLKYVDLRRHPSIEFGIMLVFIYAPYGLAEGIHLSGMCTTYLWSEKFGP